jgi:hypothetical protein
MADSITPNLNLTQPEVGASTDTWGTKLNTDLGQIDSLFAPGGKLLISSGGTGASDAATARGNLGCGTISTQNATAVSIGGGTATGLTIATSTIDACPVGSTTASTGRFTALQLSVGPLTFADGTSQASSASALSSPSVFSISASGNVSAVPIWQTEKVDCTSGAITRILPSAAGITGHIVTLKKWDTTSNVLSYVTTGGQTIDGLPGSGAIFRYLDALTFQADGGNWILI